jgi:hypothetical protein
VTLGPSLLDRHLLGDHLKYGAWKAVDAAFCN